MGEVFLQLLLNQESRVEKKETEAEWGKVSSSFSREFGTIP